MSSKFSPGIHQTHVKILILIILNMMFASGSSEPYQFKTGYFEVPLDHFSYTTSKTFKIKYIYNDTYWNKSKNGPIFFYTGNEGTIELFAQNTGFMWDIAPEFGALLLFAEHRYYGDSMPFGNQSLTTPDKAGFLTSEQALADFADLLVWYKAKEDAEKSPVIAFGGSYGGMLTAWMRMKYPHIIQGGIAGSAPVAQFTGLTPCTKFSRIVTEDFRRVSANCTVTIRKSWDIINSLGKHEAGREWMSKNFRLCRPLTNQSDISLLKEWLTDMYGNLAMINYPYANSFLEPVPGHPVKAFCGVLANADDSDKVILRSIFKGMSIYFNHTGQAKCLDISDEATGNLAAGGWDFQACTEMVMPMCSDGILDFFEPSPWNLTKYSEDCFERFGVRPRPMAAATIYGGRNISSVTNLVFSNGLLDPWYGGGILSNLSDSAIAIIIPEGAHHLDLRSKNPSDPPSVRRAREIEKREIAKWINDYRQGP